MIAVADRAGVAGREVFAAFGPLFRYPDAALPQRLDEAAALSVLIDANAGEDLLRFVAELGAGDLARQQVVYTETFDVAPLCSPYVGAHMFGDDSPARSRLLTTLRELQQTRHATASASELPDHLSELFAFAPCLREDEWTELRALLLLPALQKMNAILAGSENPYRHLISAALRLTAATLSEEGAR